MVNSVSFSISQIGERMIKLEELLSYKYPELPWEKARRMRNIIVHDYDNSNPEIIYNTATRDLEELKNMVYKIKDDIKHISDNSILTERLIIRPWDDLDGDELFELAKDPEIGKRCGWEPHKHMRDTMFVLHNFLEKDGTYAICLQNNDVIGSVGLNFKEDTELANKDDECELGYWIGKPYWGRGYATEACCAIIAYAFDNLGVSTIWCSCFDDNKKSEKVIKKLGFEFCYAKEHKFKTDTSDKKTNVYCLKRKK